MENRLKCVKIQDDRCIYAIWRRDMKKLLLSSFVFFFCMLGSIAGVEASCYERELGAWTNGTKDEYLYQSKSRAEGKMAFECGGGYCDGGQVIFMPANHRHGSEDVAEPKIYYCAAVGDQMWIEWDVSDIADCDERQCRMTDASDTSKILGYYFMDTSGGSLGLASGSGAQLLVQSMTSICKCRSVGEDINACVNSGGTWSGNSCSCSSSKNLKKTVDGKSCECISSDYESDGVNGCKKKQSVIEKEEQQRQRDEQNRRNQQLSKACTDSGGVWKSNKCQCDSAKNLKVANNVCVCLDDTIYVRNGDRCDLTDREALKRKCEAEASKASGAYWDDVNGKCKCDNSQYVWNGTVCAINEVLAQCLSIEGANWNKLTEQCYCMDSGAILPPEKMIENACSGIAFTVSQNQQEQQVSRNRILDAVKTINDIESNLDLSVWKNSEGGFNTSRLLSDSIAGVVLGTAGGLITSSVVKKNQVESGFEDIQCTVGGQVVAGWGDEFRVGIQ